MPSGIQVFDTAGNLTLDYTDDLFKICGIRSIGQNHTGGAASGSFYDARLTQFPGCIGFIQVIGSQYPNKYAPRITISGNDVNWVFPQSGAGGFTRPDVTFVFGLY